MLCLLKPVSRGHHSYKKTGLPSSLQPGIGTSPHTSTIYQTELKIVSGAWDVFINSAREHMLCYVTTLYNA